MPKTRQQLEEQLRVEERLKVERDISDRTYARKIAEVVLFTMVGMFVVAVIGALLKTVILQ